MFHYAKIPDNNGNQPKDELIIQNGQTAYFSTIRAQNGRSCEYFGAPSQVSYSAGAYVCNDLLYTLLARFENAKTRVGFIHVPYSTEQGKETCMEISDIAKGLALAIKHLD